MIGNGERVMYQNYSVLMSVYYREKAEYFREAVGSMMNQTVPPSDFVLVCDGPLTPQLEQIICEYESQNPEIFQIIRLETNQGLGNALRVGSYYCKNELIARMDSDDIADSRRCEIQLKEFADNPNLSLCGSDAAEFSESLSNITGTRKVPVQYADIVRFAKRRNPFNHMTVMFRKNDVLSAGNYITMKLFEDYYLWVRMIQKKYYMKNIDSELVYVRAGTEMFKRRGGVEYIKDIIYFQWILLSRKFISPYNFITNCMVRIIVGGLPSAIRGIIYQKVLRKESRNSVQKKGIDACTRSTK